MRVVSFVLAVLASGCTDEICKAEVGMSSCGYCAQDRATTSNPHAGRCRYCGGNVTCSGDICSDGLMCNSRVFLSVPGATFHSGPMPTPASTSSVPPVVSVTPSSQQVATGSTTRWSVHWSAPGTVTAVLFEVSALGGYYQLPLTPDQADAGTVDVPMAATAEAPGESGCQGPTTCWAEAPGTTTTGAGAVELLGAAGAAGQPRSGLVASWNRLSTPQSTGNTGGGGGTDSCPTSGAQMGCCTTRGGIQVLGFGLSAPCDCPADTCTPRAGYCGCRSCGGC